MYVCELTVDCLADVEIDAAQHAISHLLDEYRYNGQILGREFPVTFVGDHFRVIFVCPEQDALADHYNNDAVNQALARINSVGLSLAGFQVLGLECQSDHADTTEKPSALILYSTYLQSCSPLRSIEQFAPVPLYKLPESVRKPLIKWQEDQAACDQLNMNELTQLETECVRQLSEYDSELNQKALALTSLIEQELNIPVYRYLYRVGGESLKAEKLRKCPSCGSHWLLEEPLYELFDFKCDNCRLLSNISWDWQ